MIPGQSNNPKGVVTIIERLLKPNEVAETLGVSRSLTYQLIRQGVLPSVHFSRSVRVRPIDLEAFIQRNVTGQDLEHLVLAFPKGKA